MVKNVLFKRKDKQIQKIVREEVDKRKHISERIIGNRETKSRPISHFPCPILHFSVEFFLLISLFEI